MKNCSKNGSRLPGNSSWSLHVVAAPGAASRRWLPKRGSRHQKVAPEPPRRFVECRVVSCVRKCVRWLPGAAPGANKVWRLPGQLLGGGSQGKGSQGWSTAPETIPGHATMWPILFSCCGPFPKLVVDGGVF